MAAEYKKIVENFRLSIRKKQINRVFESQRRENQRMLQEEFKQSLQYQLQTQEDRRAWIQEVAGILSGEPTPEWYALLKKIHYVTNLYRDNYDLWIKLGVIKEICTLFKQQNLHLKLSKLAANILTDLLYINSQFPLNFQNVTVIKGILKEEFGSSVIKLMIENSDVEYIRLVAHLFEVAPATRNLLINQEFLAYLKQLFQRFQEFEAEISSQYILNTLFLVKQVLKIHQFDKDTFSYPKKSTIVSLLPILSKQIEKNYPINTINYVISSIKQICSLKKHQIYEQIIKYPNIIDRSIQMLFSDVDSIRKASAKLLTNFSISEDPNHIEILFEKDILDRIFEVYGLPGIRFQTRHMLLSLVSNLTADHIKYQQKIMAHPFFKEIILPQAQSSPYPEIRKQAIYNICNILANMQDAWLDNLAGQLKVFDILMDNLSQHNQTPEIIIDILDTLQLMIRNQASICQGRNKYLDIFKHGYHITDILSERTQFDDIEDKITQFIEFLDSFDN